jgi:hypothetical protein
MLERPDGSIGCKYPGAYSQQPAFDLQVYRVIQEKLTQLRKNG